MKKAIIVGHNAKEKGYYSHFLQAHEFDFYGTMEDELREIATLYYHNPIISSYMLRMQDTARRINQHDYDLVLSLHFNSFNSKANGSEGLYFHTNERGRNYANIFSSMMNEEMGYRTREPKPLSEPRQRGYFEVQTPRATTLILEPFFGDNEQDCARFDKKMFLSILKKL